MRLGYFGGSFDPPHLGHLAVARAAAGAFALDCVLFVPTANQPLKPLGSSASYADRLAMVTLLCADDASFSASGLEAPRLDHSPNYTVDTLTQLRSTLGPADEIFVLTGADTFLSLKRWREPNQLLTLAQWIVLSRPGVLFSLAKFLYDDLAPLQLTPTQRARIHHLDTLAEPASATHIRSLLHSLPMSERELLTLLPITVLDYIRNHQLYSI
jgi:nicotinate-nucleotide adenylyltransferase